MHFIFSIGSVINSKPNPCINLEFQPFLAVGQKIAFSMFFFGEIAEKNYIFCSIFKSKIPKCLEQTLLFSKNTKILSD